MSFLSSLSTHLVLYFKNKCVDVEKLISIIEEDEDLPFTMADLCTIDSAVVVLKKCNIIHKVIYLTIIYTLEETQNVPY